MRSGNKDVEGPWEKRATGNATQRGPRKNRRSRANLGVLEERGRWIKIICRHATVLAHFMGDRSREIQYTERALPYAKDYRFAVYNFARLLLMDGQVGLAERRARDQATSSKGDSKILIWPSPAHASSYVLT